MTQRKINRTHSVPRPYFAHTHHISRRNRDAIRHPRITPAQKSQPPAHSPLLAQKRQSQSHPAIKLTFEEKKP